MFVDVQANLLFFVVAAWEDDFTGYVIDYGSFPDQQRPYFTLRDARLTLPLATKASGLEGAIYAGLEQLTTSYIGRDWRRDDGAMLRIERCLIDANHWLDCLVGCAVAASILGSVLERAGGAVQPAKRERVSFA
jgi:hypothetical protein